jgi:hypothetical protein
VKTSFKRGLAAALAGSTAIAGALAATTTGPAQASPLPVANYGFEGSAFGTYASTGPVGLTSGRTAHSYIACTRRIGVNIERSITTAQAPSGNPFLNIGAVTSFSRSYRLKNGTVGTRSQNTVASVKLGPAAGPNLELKGLKTTTNAFATKAGVFGTNATFGSVDIVANTGIPEVDELFGQLGGTIGDLIKLISEQANDVLVLPGLGEIKLGDTWEKKFYSYAEANAVALKVQLYGQNAEAGGGDDIVVRIGRARSRITRNLTSGVFRGFAYGLKAGLLDNVLGIGPLGEKRMGCQGTNGKVKVNAVAGLNLGNAGVVQVGAIEGQVYGKQYDNGSAKAWTLGKVASVKLGSGGSSLEIKGIVGRANVTKYSSGKISKGIGGSRVASLIINGEEHVIPAPGEAIEIPGLARIEFLVKSAPTLRDIKVIAVRITLLDDSPGVTVIELGVAKAGIKNE